MEYRLCHYRQANTGHMERSPGSGRGLREQRESATEARLENLADATVLSAARNQLEHPEKMERALRTAETTRAERLKQTSQMFLNDPGLQRGRELLQKEGGEIPSKVAEIIGLLQTRLPEPGEEEHPYGTTAGLNFDKIEKDKEFIRLMRTASLSPEKTDALNRADAALRYLAEQDSRRLNLWTMNQEKKNSASEKAIGEVGKISLFLVSGLIGIATGAPAIIKKIRGGNVKMSDLAAPFLCFSVAAGTANEGLRKSIFGDIPSNVQDDLRAVIGNPAFRTLCTRYGIEGASWSKGVQHMIEERSETKAFAAKLKGYKTKPNDAEMAEEIDTYVQNLALGPAESAQLRRMIKEDIFLSLVHILSFVDTEDATAVIADYVRTGARRYEQNAYAMADRLKESSDL